MCKRRVCDEQKLVYNNWKDGWGEFGMRNEKKDMKMGRMWVENGLDRKLGIGEEQEFVV